MSSTSTDDTALVVEPLGVDPLAVDPANCERLFHAKADRVEALYAPFNAPPAQRHPSAPLGYRMRASFKVWHDGDDLFYAMFPPGKASSPSEASPSDKTSNPSKASTPGNPKTPLRVDYFPIVSARIQDAMGALRKAPPSDKTSKPSKASTPGKSKTPLRVDNFPIVSARIQDAMGALREQLLPNPTLRRKLFQAEFLSTLSDELLITLVYHRPLDDNWKAAAAPLERLLNAAIVGRSKGQKVVLSRDYVEEELPTAAGRFRYRQYEQAFTQPNAGVNCRMIDWAWQQAAGADGDLLELYCGNGNFTLPLATRFGRVLATEVSRQSLQAARHNCEVNRVGNVALARLSAEEMGAALRGERAFKRLRELSVPLADYRFNTLLVDPPRAGLDAATEALAAQFDRVLYISCNPTTQVENLRRMCQTHKVAALAMFDQFPYTGHLECGVLLMRG